MLMVILADGRRFCRNVESRFRYSSTILMIMVRCGSLMAVVPLPISEGGRYAAVLGSKVNVAEGEDTPVIICNDGLVLSSDLN
jgi:hypothetical protein